MNCRNFKHITIVKPGQKSPGGIQAKYQKFVLKTLSFKLCFQNIQNTAIMLKTGDN